MTSSFNVVEHSLPGQHIREYVQATRHRQEDAFSIAIKQYIPNGQPDPLPENAVTILGFHGNGFPKETYEPFFADLCADLRQRKVYVRGIWIADTSNQGASGVLNENIQGDHTHWFDHSRDVLHMVNHFRDQMPRPIIGVAHSLGCPQLVHLSTMHPRLLSTVVLIEPIIFDTLDYTAGSPHPALRTLYRRDIWTSHQEASTSLRKAFGNWDPRSLDAYVKYGLRQLPTALYNNTNSTTPLKRSNPADKPLPHPLPAGAVTLTTTKPHESWTYMQYNVWSTEQSTSGIQQQRHIRLIRPDQADDELTEPSARPEARLALKEIPHLRPSVLFIFGGKSQECPPPARDQIMAITGTGQGGNGGVKEGQVKGIILDNVDHLVTFEKVGLTPAVQASAEWLQEWFQKWLADEEFMRGYLSRVEGRSSDADSLRLSQEWVEITKKPLFFKKHTTTKDKGKL